MPTDTARIHSVGLFELMSDAHVFGEIAIGQMDLREQRFRSLVDAPTHYPRVCSIPQPAALDRVLWLLRARRNWRRVASRSWRSVRGWTSASKSTVVSVVAERPICCVPASTPNETSCLQPLLP